MPNSNCREFLQRLRTTCKVDNQLLLRQGNSFPELVQLLLQIVREGSTDELKLLLDVPKAVEAAWKVVDDELSDSDRYWFGPGWISGDEPWEQTKHLLFDLLISQNKSAEAGIPGALAPHTASNSEPLHLRSLWWLETIAHWKTHQQASVSSLVPQDSMRSVSINLLLIDQSSDKGLVAVLTLHRVKKQNARMALAPLAASAFLPCTTTFQDALTATTKCCNRHIKCSEGRDTALAWDIVVPNGKLAALDGESAGAALGLAALWLMRDLLPSGGSLRLHLKRISWEHVAKVYLTASLLDSDKLGTVTGIDKKTKALTEYIEKGSDEVTVYVAPAIPNKREQIVPNVRLQIAENLQDLVEALARKALSESGPRRHGLTNPYIGVLGLVLLIATLGIILANSDGAKSSTSLRNGKNGPDCSGCPDMVYLPGGKAYLGSPLQESKKNEAVRHELPAREVAVSNLMMADTEITNAQWKVCVDEGRCKAKLERFGHFPSNDLPVTDLTFDEAQAYVAWLREKSKIASYRLPSEREWEYAARAQSLSEIQTPYSTGATITHADARFGPDPTNKSGPGPVKKYLPNAFKLYDMHGNVGEMTSGCHRETAPGDYLNESVDSSACEWFAIRGGAWNSEVSSLRSAARRHNMYRGSPRRPADASPDVGFRVARDVQ
jgi:formylglycine-generating enzyme required for sulfatase activity